MAKLSDLIYRLKKLSNNRNREGDIVTAVNNLNAATEGIAQTVNQLVNLTVGRYVSLLDFPEKEDAGEWINDAIIYAYDNGFDSVRLPADGRLLEVESTIRLRRGVILVGGSTFDDRNGTILTRAAGFSAPILATDKWFEPSNPVESHYYGACGICIDGNSASNPTPAIAVAIWGAFVGSYFDNIFVLDNNGTAISFEHSYDLLLGLVWINNCTTGASAGIAIDQQLTATGPIGILEFKSLYIENLRVTSGGGTPQATPANRGTAIKVGNIGRINIENYHFESVDAAIQITHGTNECVRIGQWSGAWLGYASGNNAFIRLESSPQTLDVGCGKVVSKESGYKWLALSASVVASNQYKEYVSTQARWGGIKSSISNQAVYLGFYQWGNAVQEIVGGASSVTYRMQTSNANVDNNHYFKGAGANFSIGSRHSQPADVDFILIESTGGAGDKIRLLQPFIIPSRSSAASVSSKSIYEFTNSGQVGPCYQRVGGSANDADYIATVKQTGASTAPTENALYIGQIFVTRGSTPRNAYIAVNVGTGATDWRLITS